MVKPFIFYLTLCCSASAIASNWEQFSTSTDGQKSFTDFSRIKKDAYGLQTFTAWWQLKLLSVGAVNGKKFKSVLYLYRVDCAQASTTQLSANYYDASGSVIHVDENQYRPSIASPDSTGEAFVQAICAAANAPAKPPQTVSNPTTTATDPSMGDAVKSVLTSALDNVAPPVPEFTDTEARLNYLTWLGSTSEKLKAKKPEWQLRKEFLQTVWFESQRAGIDTSLTLGLIETLSDFRKYNVLDSGARGYMAINPVWSRKIGDGDVSKLFHMQTNMRFGCVVLRHYLDQRHGDIKTSLLDYAADSLSIPRTDPRVSKLVDRIALASEKWR